VPSGCPARAARRASLSLSSVDAVDSQVAAVLLFDQPEGQRSGQRNVSTGTRDKPMHVVGPGDRVHRFRVSGCEYQIVVLEQGAEPSVVGLAARQISFKEHGTLRECGIAVGSLVAYGDGFDRMFVGRKAIVAA